MSVDFNVAKAMLTSPCSVYIAEGRFITDEITSVLGRALRFVFPTVYASTSLGRDYR